MINQIPAPVQLYLTYFNKGFQVLFRDVYYWYLKIKTGGNFHPLNVSTNLRINSATGEIMQLFSWSQIISPLWMWLIIFSFLTMTSLPLFSLRRPVQLMLTLSVLGVLSLVAMGWFFVNEEFIGEALSFMAKAGAEKMAANNATPQMPVHAEL